MRNNSATELGNSEKLERRNEIEKLKRRVISIINWNHAKNNGPNGGECRERKKKKRSENKNDLLACYCRVGISSGGTFGRKSGPEENETIRISRPQTHNNNYYDRRARKPVEIVVRLKTAGESGRYGKNTILEFAACASREISIVPNPRRGHADRLVARNYAFN